MDAVAVEDPCREAGTVETRVGVAAAGAVWRADLAGGGAHHALEDTAFALHRGKVEKILANDLAGGERSQMRIVLIEKIAGEQHLVAGRQKTVAGIVNCERILGAEAAFVVGLVGVGLGFCRAGGDDNGQRNQYDQGFQFVKGGCVRVGQSSFSLLELHRPGPLPRSCSNVLWTRDTSQLRLPDGAERDQVSIAELGFENWLLSKSFENFRQGYFDIRTN